ncbi:MAG TPA: serine/threonine-protein kinase [Archangium sp.]|uniref:serine/threonine protein kinase n=1 Tax=Archangium sp. TaxID=1872627 RepID=UPI002E35D55F|nr:serine/threonine-protein kinase [Archangium sp.]HEX5745581.1 serine/threonine-protein kinase [Archangium sp.]
MSEASTRSGGQEQQRPGAVEPLEEEASPWRPRPGLVVAGYTLEARLGTGGQGTVFRASRGGVLYAVKFLFLPRTARWAWRERDVMLKLSSVGGLPLVQEGVWPEHQPFYLFLVMPLVRGLPLDVWTRVHNPCALEVAHLFGQGARQLAVVHAAGVVHRDVKGANLLVHGEGQVVLVDFGVATYEGAPRLTGAFPPGTWSYLSPRVWRAWRGLEDSRACPGDDVWALGVELYLALTGALPFRGREGELVHAVLHEEPPVPHACNPRVPRALGEVCWRMLRKVPEERYPDALAVEAALAQALNEADDTWREPLCEAWGPHHATTVLEGDMWRGADVLALYERRASYARVPVRGRPRAPDEVSTLLPQAPPEAPAAGTAPVEPPVPPPAQGEAPEVTPQVAVPPVAAQEALPLAGPEVPRAVDEAPAVTPPAPRVREAARPAARSRRALLAAGAVLALGLGLWLAMRPPPPAAVRTASPLETPRASLPGEFLPISLEPGGQEVASPWKRPEGDAGATPPGAATPAPVAPATPPPETRVKTPAKEAKTPTLPKQTGSTTTKVGAAVLGCALATGCPSPATTAQVLPTPPLPPPAECPPGAQQAMKELELTRESEGVTIHPFPGKATTTVRPGLVTMRLNGQDHWGKLPRDTLFTGQLLFGERVQARLTQAYTPEGQAYPVCLEVTSGRYWGWEKEEGSGQDTAVVRSISTALRPVKRFGEASRYEDQ